MKKYRLTNPAYMCHNPFDTYQEAQNYAERRIGTIQGIQQEKLPNGLDNEKITYLKHVHLSLPDSIIEEIDID